MKKSRVIILILVQCWCCQYLFTQTFHSKMISAVSGFLCFFNTYYTVRYYRKFQYIFSIWISNLHRRNHIDMKECSVQYLAFLFFNNRTTYYQPLHYVKNGSCVNLIHQVQWFWSVFGVNIVDQTFTKNMKNIGRMFSAVFGFWFLIKLHMTNHCTLRFWVFVFSLTSTQTLWWTENIKHKTVLLFSSPSPWTKNVLIQNNTRQYFEHRKEWVLLKENEWTIVKENNWEEKREKIIVHCLHLEED